MPVNDKTLLNVPLPALNDVEGERLPCSLPAVVDAHVHLFPDGLFKAVQAWFDQHGWPIRYRLSSAEVLCYLFDRGVEHVVGLQYAHKGGMAAGLNDYMVELCARFPRLVGLATIFPGETDAEQILKKAFDRGLKGVKLHIHVQGFDMNGPELDTIYRCCIEHDRPLLMHAGREPKSPAYAHDPYQLCDVNRVERVIRVYPELRLCVPHMGIDETRAYAELIERYDNLWLDTTMALADYFPNLDLPVLSDLRLERIMYGSDFPNIPYAWDRELKRLLAMDLSEHQLTQILGATARGFYGIKIARSGLT